MRFFYSLLISVVLGLSSVAQAADIGRDFFESIAEYQSGIAYLPKIDVDFLAVDAIGIQLQLAEDGWWDLVAANLAEKKSTDVSLYMTNNILTLPLVRIEGSLVCHNVRFLMSENIRFQLLGYEECSDSLNTFINNTEVIELPAIDSQTSMTADGRKTARAESLPAVPANQHYLLIHGMNSDEFTWDDLVNQWFGGNCPIIVTFSINGNSGAKFLDSPVSIENTQCVRIHFGLHERVGLNNDGIEELLTWEHGDGATFGQLGAEVGAAVNKILEKKQDARITLVGHSRGGLAARAFLQSDAAGIQNINGLLTIGTPHTGSPLGRIYQWLKDHPRNFCSNLPCKKDWDAADLIYEKSGLKVGSPTINDLASGSDAISFINSNVSKLPGIVYGGVVSPNVKFGVLDTEALLWFDGDIYSRSTDPNIGISDAAISFLEGGKTRKSLKGDGIVPEDSQRLNLVTGFPAKKIWMIRWLNGKNGESNKVGHIHETKEVATIVSILTEMATKYPTLPPTPSAPLPTPTTGTWTSPHTITVNAANADKIYCMVTESYDGSEPPTPAIPTEASNDSCVKGGSFITGSSGQFGLWNDRPNTLARIKVIFRAQNSNGYGPASPVYEYKIDLRQQQTLPGAVTITPATGTWTTTPQFLNVSVPNAERIYCTLRSTDDGTEPETPPDPIIDTGGNDPCTGALQYITGSNGQFEAWGTADKLKRLKVKFRGWNGQGYGPVSAVFSYSIDLRPVTPLPGVISVSPTTGNWTSTPQLINVSVPNAGRIYCTLRSTDDGTEPETPPDPIIDTGGNDPCTGALQYITGSNGQFEAWGTADKLKRLKVKFRGWNGQGYGPTSATYEYSIDLRQQQALPGAVTITPTSGTWTTTPQFLPVSASGAERIYCMIDEAYDGAVPPDPVTPSEATNDPCVQGGSFISGSSGQFQLWGQDGKLMHLKVRFRAWNSAGYGPVSSVYSYTMDLRGTGTVTTTASKRIAAGAMHTCVLTNGGGVKCWGYNGDGQLGDGTTINRTTPVAISGLSSGVTAIAAGYGHTCALVSGGGVMCWGYNGEGRLGDGTTTNSAVPVAVSGLSGGVTAISAGNWHTCALTSSGGVKCWGYNSYGQLGDGTTTDRLVPVAVSGMSSGVTAISAGGDGTYAHSCALTSTGEVKCWGSNMRGQLSNDRTIIESHTPIAVLGLSSGVEAIAAGGNTCALTGGGEVVCWGDTYYALETVSDVGSANAIVAGDYHSCAITGSGGAKCWGSNYRGQLGNGTTDQLWTPVSVVGLDSGVAAITAGKEYTCAMISSGGVRCWGNNDYGQLGDGTTTDRLTPVDVVGF